jgi:hypothetical protein
MLSWMVRHPFHTGVMAGLIIALAFGLLSFPNESSIQKTVDDWLPEGAASDEAEIDALITALEDARAGEGALREVSEQEFREMGLDSTYAFPETRKDGSFGIRYVGQEAEDDSTVVVAERTVDAAPWWHPDRLLYRAVRAETDRFS